MSALGRLGLQSLLCCHQQFSQTLRSAACLGAVNGYSTVAVASVSEQLREKSAQGFDQPSSSGRDGGNRESESRKVTTTEPWPWVVPMLPQILPKAVTGNPRKVKMPLDAAIAAVKANASAQKAGTPEQLRSGRARARISPNANESVEICINLLTDPRKSDQLVRGVVVMPHGTGKSVKVAAFCTGADVEAAKAAGADVVGGEELVQKIIDTDGAAIEFDRLVATPPMMKVLARAGRVLGPRNLMPNPKMGTLTPDIAAAVKEMRAGRLEFRVSPKPILQTVVGKASFTEEQLLDNITTLLSALVTARPSVLPGSGVNGYISSIFLKTTMTQPVSIDLKSVAAAVASNSSSDASSSPAGEDKAPAADAKA